MVSRDREPKQKNMNTITRESWNRGDTIAIVHTEIKNVDGVLVTDFTGFIFQATLKASKSDADSSAIIKLNTSDHVLNDANSSAKVYLETESLSLSLETDYFLDAQIIDANGYVSTTLERIILFKRDITQRVTNS